MKWFLVDLILNHSLWHPDQQQIGIELYGSIEGPFATEKECRENYTLLGRDLFGRDVPWGEMLYGPPSLGTGLEHVFTACVTKVSWPEDPVTEDRP